MQNFDLERARKSLGRGLARQTIDLARQDNADTARILTELHDLAPNPRNRVRFAKRLRGRAGVVSVAVHRDGLVIVLRSALDVAVHEDGIEAYVEPRLGWMQIKARAGRGQIRFEVHCVQASLHAMQRRVERSRVEIGDFSSSMDLSMVRALGWLSRRDPLRDRSDAYIPAQDGVWAGRAEHTAFDPSWGPAFRGAAHPLPVFSVRTYLDEEQMRPLVWHGWANARCGDRAAQSKRVYGLRAPMSLAHRRSVLPPEGAS